MRAAAATLVVVALAAAAGCDRAVEMRLVPIGDEVDTSCVTAVELTLTGRLFEEEVYHCVEVRPGQVRSLRQHGLEGMFDVPLPPFDVIGVQVRGVAAAEGCTNGFAIGPTIFVASTDSTEDDLEMPLRGVLSCADRVDQPTPVRVVDLASLVTDGTCASVEGFEVQPSVLFPSMLYHGYSGYQWNSDVWTLPITSDADGMVQLPYTFTAASSGSCLGLFTYDGATIADGCLTPPGRGACGSEAEYHYVPFATTRDASLSIEQIVTHLNIVFGVVLDRQRRPIAGATIKTFSADAEVLYTAPAGEGYTRLEATATAAAGTFTVLADRPALIEVTAPGMTTRRVMAGGTGATIVVMDAAP